MRLKIIVQMCAFDGARRRAFSLYGATRARRGELCDNLMCFEIIYARESAAINIFDGFRSLWHYGIIYIYVYITRVQPPLLVSKWMCVRRPKWMMRWSSRWNISVLLGVRQNADVKKKKVLKFFWSFIWNSSSSTARSTLTLSLAFASAVQRMSITRSIGLIRVIPS